jgi:putative N6-adenine-specific DNA methylase
MLTNELLQVEKLYFDMGELWKKNFKGSRAAIFTGYLPGLKKISLKSKKKHILYNGDIECRLAEYELF